MSKIRLTRHPSWALAALGGVLLLASLAIFGHDLLFGAGYSSGRDAWPARFSSNGERIYFTGTSASGRPIGTSGGGMHMQMHVSGCVVCHGADRQGRRQMPRFWVAAPPLTPAALFGDGGEAAADHGHDDHQAYDEETLARAITRGVDAAGNPLDGLMPRWSMGEADLRDLIVYLKSPARAPYTW